MFVGVAAGLYKGSLHSLVIAGDVPLRGRIMQGGKGFSRY